MPEPTLQQQILNDIKEDPSIVSEAIGQSGGDDKPGDTAVEKIATQPSDTAPPENTDVDVQPATTIESEVDADKPADQKAPTVEDQIKILSDTVKDLAARVTAFSQPHQPEQSAQPTIDPSSTDLLAGVYDEASLQRAEKDLENLVAFAETHRDGAYDYEVRDEKGNSVKKDFTPEQVTNIKLRAESALRALPKRREYLALRARCDATAKEVYPDLFKEESSWRKDTAQILAAVPQLAQVPDFLIWIGHALRGRDEFLKAQAGKTNGKEQSAAVEKIRSAPREVAPAVVTTRGTIARTDQQKRAAAEKRLATEGSEEAAEELLAAMGI